MHSYFLRNALSYSSQQLAYIVASMQQIINGEDLDGVEQVAIAVFCFHAGFFMLWYILE